MRQQRAHVEHRNRDRQPARPDHPAGARAHPGPGVGVWLLAAGCWAQFYSKRDFQGDFVTLVGPAQVQSMDKGTAKQLKRDIGSVSVGPRATLEVYEHAMFKDRTVSFAPNSREGGLVRKLGFGGRIEAMKLSCS
ncbi:hypothetical protein VLK31_30200 [Variovorax sp. H27-G14]|uniref:hypothetical protein n=1 Tax=Variovorax sp. H27-G14 TaxID=3111914 RepID=UPI0038FBF176